MAKCRRNWPRIRNTDATAQILAAPCPVEKMDENKRKTNVTERIFPTAMAANDGGSNIFESSFRILLKLTKPRAKFAQHIRIAITRKT